MVTIYVLFDPETNKPRYVGRTLREPKLRKQEHARDTRRGLHKFLFVVLDRSKDVRRAAELEARWVKFYQQRGEKLLNTQFV